MSLLSQGHVMSEWPLKTAWNSVEMQVESLAV